MEDKKTGKQNSINNEFMKIIEAGKAQRDMKRDISTRQINDSANDIFSEVINDMSQESLVQGLVYGEIFGQPKCRRRGR